jgi:hypothetical protein
MFKGLKNRLKIAAQLLESKKERRKENRKIRLSKFDAIACA